MKRVRSLSIGIVLASVSVGPLLGVATARAATPVCSSTMWTVGLSAQQEIPITMNLMKCGKTLSRTAAVGASKDVISGTLTKKGKVSMTWDGSHCGQSVISLTGTPKVKKGTGRGPWSDSNGASGNRGASRTA